MSRCSAVEEAESWDGLIDLIELKELKPKISPTVKNTAKAGYVECNICRLLIENGLANNFVINVYTKYCWVVFLAH